MKVSPKLNIYAVISRAVSEGSAYGIHRAFKHTDEPPRDTLIEHVEREVMNALCDVIDFGDDDETPPQSVAQAIA